MAHEFQIVVDSGEPIALARFWASTLGYVMEDNSDLVQRMLDIGAAGEDDYTVVDGRKAWRLLSAIRHPDDPVEPSTGAGLGRRILFQHVPESKTVKNRMHLDMRVGPERRSEEVARLVALGATEVRTVEEHGSRFVSMRDPEGNEFDVQ
ncbi:hypothetical protein J4H86_02385 [Spiractinospora alimapuensis]|uniref:VOC family protein n=1 Tax=Spiractinospora alimapuensis TaxID=2820884 RepID=UPI001F45E276|nr:VOC family protein [Spiractinospora alimapuensis]QVQ52699.1 hypothetical protein J4H86_02385 [Spiractinospora alimapuensis]